MKRTSVSLFWFILLSFGLFGQTDSMPSINRQISLRAHSGFIIPHAIDLAEVSRTKPFGLELAYTRLRLDQAAYERCNCFARTGYYLHYFDFQKPDILGRTIGAGGFYEPLLWRGALYGSVRAAAGINYLTHVYDATTNPTNRFFSLPISGYLALSLNLNWQFTPTISLSASGHYNHISNGGLRLPNKGMNFPTLAVGLAWQPRALPLPNPNRWPRPRLRSGDRWIKRIMMSGTIRVIDADGTNPESARWVGGVLLTGGYRLNRFHALVGGVEAVGDGYIQAQLERAQAGRPYGQLALMVGYELWAGRYVFSILAGRHLVHPGPPYTQTVYQRYQLLYRFRPRLFVGLGLQAVANVAGGFDLRAGYNF